MCGIVGYTGDVPAAKLLLDGLSRLEYRGYDSAGLCLLNQDFSTVKTVGKVRNLAEKVRDCQVDGLVGIAHTRWATHGAPLEKNAHPHLDDGGRVAVVHNGIIENYMALRSRLEKRGHKFISDTDSEVIPHLIAEFYDDDPVQAVAAALRQLTGTYGVCVLFRDRPGLMIAARSGSPVIVGLGQGSNMAASDVTALITHTRNVIYLNDGELAVITPEKVELRTLANVPIEREISRITWDPDTIGKGGYEHFMIKEIFEQPEALANTIRGRVLPDDGSAKLSGLNMTPREMAMINRIVIPGCGSSLHSGLIGEYYFEDIAGIPAEVEQAAEFRYRNPIIEPNTLVLPISQSGETADTLAAVREAIHKGAVVAAISNVVGSTIARECGRGVYLHAGPEISVASTKAFTCQVAALLLMSLLFGRSRRLSGEDGREIGAEIARLPELVQSVLDEFPTIERIAKKYAAFNDFFFIGRGCLYPVALEGALKLKEVSYVHAEGYHAAELKHGPMSLLGDRVPVIALANRIPGQEKLLGNIEECLARRSPVIAVVSGEDANVAKYTSDIIRVPASSRYAAPITTVVALQIFAYCFARERKCDIDQPRNLAKSVTVE